MAALQGYFLRNKDDAKQAITNISQILENVSSNRHTIGTGPIPVNKNNRNVVKSRPVKPLTIEQIDKMYFNPQPGWDDKL